MGNSLLLHVPKTRHYLYPFNTVSVINFMPVGLVSMAAYATDNGCPTKIIHVGLEKILDADYDISRDIEEYIPQAIGISLHWHHSAYDAIALAKRIKEKHKEIFIVLGGYTASFFSKEILAEFQFIDAVIRGDGEIPWLVLQKGDFQKKIFFDVPNLSWRCNGSIVENELTYVSNDADFNRFDFCRLNLIKNNEYLAQLYWVSFVDNPRINKILLHRKRGQKVFYLPVARGCSQNCFYCGGGEKAQLAINKRNAVATLTPKIVVDHAQRCIVWGYNMASCNFDVRLPGGYFDELFDEFKKRNFYPKIRFEFFSFLPEAALVRNFSATFAKGSEITINLMTADEEYRRRHSCFHFSNEEFVKCVDMIVSQKIRPVIFFIKSLPNESKRTREQTKKMQRFLRRKYPGAGIIESSLNELDPASPLYLFPDKFGVSLTRKKFMDYYHAHAQEKPGYGFTNVADIGAMEEQISYFETGLTAGFLKFMLSTPLAGMMLKIFFGHMPIKKQDAG